MSFSPVGRSKRVWLGFYVDNPTILKLADDHTMPHITFVFCGDTLTPEHIEKLKEKIKLLTKYVSQFQVTAADSVEIWHPRKYIVKIMRVPDWLLSTRETFVNQLDGADIPYSKLYNWTPHITLGRELPNTNLHDYYTDDLTFTVNRIFISVGDNKKYYNLKTGI